MRRAPVGLVSRLLFCEIQPGYNEPTPTDVKRFTASLGILVAAQVSLTEYGADLKAEDYVTKHIVGRSGCLINPPDSGGGHGKCVDLSEIVRKTLPLSSIGELPPSMRRRLLTLLPQAGFSN